ISARPATMTRQTSRSSSPPVALSPGASFHRSNPTWVQPAILGVTWCTRPCVPSGLILRFAIFLPLQLLVEIDEEGPDAVGQHGDGDHAPELVVIVEPFPDAPAGDDDDDGDAPVQRPE